MSWHFLQEQEEASWEGSSLDGAPSALLSLMPTAAACSSPDSEMGSSRPSPSGTTSAPSTGGHGEGASMSSAEDSPARTSPALEAEQGSTARAVGSGWKWRGSFAKYDPATSSWRTRQCSLAGGLDAYSGIWPRWGSMRDGECLVQSMSAPPTDENASGLLPTPTKRDWKDTGSAEALRRQVKNGHQATLGRAVGGALNPTWVEWLMGWPIGWTDSQPLAMAKFRQWFDSHGRR